MPTKDSQSPVAEGAAFITEGQERAIATMMEGDLTQKEAAARLRLSTRTINTHMSNARKAFGVRTNIALIIRLLREGQIAVPGLMATNPIGAENDKFRQPGFYQGVDDGDEEQASVDAFP